MDKEAMPFLSGLRSREARRNRTPQQSLLIKKQRMSASSPLEMGQSSHSSELHLWPVASLDWWCDGAEASSHVAGFIRTCQKSWEKSNYKGAFFLFWCPYPSVIHQDSSVMFKKTKKMGDTECNLSVTVAVRPDRMHYQKNMITNDHI